MIFLYFQRIFLVNSIQNEAVQVRVPFSVVILLIWGLYIEVQLNSIQYKVSFEIIKRFRKQFVRCSPGEGHRVLYPEMIKYDWQLYYALAI